MLLLLLLLLSLSLLLFSVFCCFLYRCCCFLYCCCCFFIVLGSRHEGFCGLSRFFHKKPKLEGARLRWQEYLGLSRQILASFRPRSRRPMCQRQADQVDMILLFAWGLAGRRVPDGRARSCFPWELGKLWLVFNRGPL